MAALGYALTTNRVVQLYPRAQFSLDVLTLNGVVCRLSRAQ